MRFHVPIRSVAKGEYDDLLYGLGGGDDVRTLCRLIDLAKLYITELEKGAEVVCGYGVFLRRGHGMRWSLLPAYSGRATIRTFELPDFPWHWKFKRIRARAARVGITVETPEAFIDLLVFWGHVSFVAVAMLGTEIVAIGPNGKRTILRYRPLESIRRHFLPRM